MASETDVRIARAVALKAAVELVNGNVILLADLEAKATELVTFLLDINPARHETGDPGPTPPVESPPDVWPEDEAIGPPRDDYEHQGPTGTNATQGPVGQAAPSCKCGKVMEFTKGEDWTAYFCPNQTKSRDPRIQDEQKLLHPPVWL